MVVDWAAWRLQRKASKDQRYSGAIESTKIIAKSSPAMRTHKQARRDQPTFAKNRFCAIETGCLKQYTKYTKYTKYRKRKHENKMISIDRNSAKQNGSRSARHTKKKGMSMLINACLCRLLRKLTAHATATHMRNNMIRDKCCCLKKGSNKKIAYISCWEPTTLSSQPIVTILGITDFLHGIKIFWQSTTRSN